MIWAEIAFWLAYAGVGVAVAFVFVDFHKGQQKPDKAETILLAFGASVGLFCMGMIAGALLQCVA